MAFRERSGFFHCAPPLSRVHVVVCKTFGKFSGKSWTTRLIDNYIVLRPSFRVRSNAPGNEYERIGSRVLWSRPRQLHPVQYPFENCSFAYLPWQFPLWNHVHVAGHGYDVPRNIQLQLSFLWNAKIDNVTPDEISTRGRAWSSFNGERDDFGV